MEYFKSVGMRFVRGFVAGAVSSMIIVKYSGAVNLSDIGNFFSTLGISALIGGVTGGLLAVDKGIRTYAGE